MPITLEWKFHSKISRISLKIVAQYLNNDIMCQVVGLCKYSHIHVYNYSDSTVSETTVYSEHTSQLTPVISTPVFELFYSEIFTCVQAFMRRC